MPAARLAAAGALPAGLGARDTLRLEAGLPLYGHEPGLDPEGNEIPVMSSLLASSAVSFSPRKGDYVGRAALARQHAAHARILQRDYSLLADLPRLTRPLTITGRGITRAGARVYAGAASAGSEAGTPPGWVTSGTAVPCWRTEGEGLGSAQTEGHELRSIALACIDSRVLNDDAVEVEVRGERIPAPAGPYHLRSDAPPGARAIVRGRAPGPAPLGGGGPRELAMRLLTRAANDDVRRQQECIHLIPSETTSSPMARLFGVTDPAFRSPAVWRRTASSATARHCPTRRASPPAEPCALGSPR